MSRVGGVGSAVVRDNKWQQLQLIHNKIQGGTKRSKSGLLTQPSILSNKLLKLKGFHGGNQKGTMKHHGRRGGRREVGGRGGHMDKDRHHRTKCVRDSDCTKVQFAFCFLRKCRKRSLPAGGSCMTDAWCDSGKCANNICT